MAESEGSQKSTDSSERESSGSSRLDRTGTVKLENGDGVGKIRLELNLSAKTSECDQRNVEKGFGRDELCHNQHPNSCIVVPSGFDSRALIDPQMNLFYENNDHKVNSSLNYNEFSEIQTIRGDTSLIPHAPELRIHRKCLGRAEVRCRLKGDSKGCVDRMCDVVNSTGEIDRTRIQGFYFNCNVGPEISNSDGYERDEKEDSKILLLGDMQIGRSLGLDDFIHLTVLSLGTQTGGWLVGHSSFSKQYEVWGATVKEGQKINIGLSDIGSDLYSRGIMLNVGNLENETITSKERTATVHSIDYGNRYSLQNIPDHNITSTNNIKNHSDHLVLYKFSGNQEIQGLVVPKTEICLNFGVLRLIPEGFHDKTIHSTIKTINIGHQKKVLPSGRQFQTALNHPAQCTCFNHGVLGKTSFYNDPCEKGMCEADSTEGSHDRQLNVLVEELAQPKMEINDNCGSSCDRLSKRHSKSGSRTSRFSFPRADGISSHKKTFGGKRGTRRLFSASSTRRWKTRSLSKNFNARSCRVKRNKNVNSGGSVMENEGEANRFMGEYLYELWKNGYMCDVLIRTGNESFLAHKIVLAAYSDVFCPSEPKPDPTLHVEIPNTSSTAVYQILNYLYTSEMEVDEENMEDVLNAALFLGVRDIVDLIKDILLNPTKENIVQYLEIIDRLNMPISLSANPHLYQNFLQEISDSQVFKKMDVKTMKKVLNDQEVMVESETDLLEALCKWTEGDMDNHLKSVPGLLRYINFVCISPSVLSATVANYPHIFNNAECQAILAEVYKSFATTDIENEVAPLGSSDSESSENNIKSLSMNKSGRPTASTFGAFPTRPSEQLQQGAWPKQTNQTMHRICDQFRTRSRQNDSKATSRPTVGSQSGMSGEDNEYLNYNPRTIQQNTERGQKSQSMTSPLNRFSHFNSMDARNEYNTRLDDGDPCKDLYKDESMRHKMADPGLPAGDQYRESRSRVTHQNSRLASSRTSSAPGLSRKSTISPTGEMTHDSTFGSDFRTGQSMFLNPSLDENVSHQHQPLSCSIYSNRPSSSRTDMEDSNNRGESYSADKWHAQNIHKGFNHKSKMESKSPVFASMSMPKCDRGRRKIFNQTVRLNLKSTGRNSARDFHLNTSGPAYQRKYEKNPNNKDINFNLSADVMQGNALSGWEKRKPRRAFMCDFKRKNTPSQS